MTEIRTSHTVTIEAPIEPVWTAITTPELIKGWFFGVETESDWRAGSALVHRGEYQGKPYADKGVIVRIEPPALLLHTHWSEPSGLPDDPANYQRVTWSLNERGGITELTVDEDNLPSEEAKTISDRSWPMALDNLRTTLEQRA
jgi:uncharacterized protein YndB with AHSA1/START domain